MFDLIRPCLFGVFVFLRFCSTVQVVLAALRARFALDAWLFLAALQSCLIKTARCLRFPSRPNIPDVLQLDALIEVTCSYCSDAIQCGMAILPDVVAALSSSDDVCSVSGSVPLLPSPLRRLPAASRPAPGGSAPRRWDTKYAFK